MSLVVGSQGVSAGSGDWDKALSWRGEVRRENLSDALEIRGRE